MHVPTEILGFVGKPTTNNYKPKRLTLLAPTEFSISTVMSKRLANFGINRRFVLPDGDSPEGEPGTAGRLTADEARSPARLAHAQPRPEYELRHAPEPTDTQAGHGNEGHGRLTDAGGWSSVTSRWVIDLVVPAL